MAEGLLKTKLAQLGLAEQFEVRSAGVAAYAGSPASMETRKVLLSHGLDYEDFRSSAASKYLLDESRYIFCLSNMHRQAIITEYPEYNEKILLVGEFLGTNEASDIADPYGQSEAAYKHVEQQLLGALDRIVPFIQEGSEHAPTL